MIVKVLPATVTLTAVDQLGFASRGGQVTDGGVTRPVARRLVGSERSIRRSGGGPPMWCPCW